MESNHLTATLLNVSTGLQPATGNTLQYSKTHYHLWCDTWVKVKPFLVCFRIPSISRRYDRVNTLPSYLYSRVLSHGFIQLSARLRLIKVCLQDLVSWAYSTYSTLLQLDLFAELFSLFRSYTILLRTIYLCFKQLFKLFWAQSVRFSILSFS